MLEFSPHIHPILTFPHQEEGRNFRREREFASKEEVDWSGEEAPEELQLSQWKSAFLSEEVHQSEKEPYPGDGDAKATGPAPCCLHKDDSRIVHAPPFGLRFLRVTINACWLIPTTPAGAGGRWSDAGSPRCPRRWSGRVPRGRDAPRGCPSPARHHRVSALPR